MIRKVIAIKYKAIPLPLKATIWFAVCQILQKGFSILITPIMTRMLSTEEYGKVSTYMAWEGIFAIFITLSSGHAVLNLCAKEDNKEKALSIVLGLNLSIALIWLFVLGLFKQQVCRILGFSWFLVLCLFVQSVAQSNIWCSILTTPLFTRILSTKEYGRISVYLSWESMVSLFITLSSGKAIMNLCVRHSDTNKISSSLTDDPMMIANSTSTCIQTLKPIWAGWGIGTGYL